MDAIQFVGGVQDAGDLVYLKARHYNPVLGRFYQPDPVTFLEKGHGQTNRYQYGWNDSYSFSDRFGLDVESVEKFVSVLNETMNIGWNNSFPSPLTIRENGAQLSFSLFGNPKIISYMGPETTEGGYLPSYNRTPLLYNYMAKYHTHPYVARTLGMSFSGGDIFGLTDRAGTEYKLGFVKIVEAGNMRFALEVANVRQAREFAKNWTFDSLDKHFNDVLLPAAQGNTWSDRSRNAVSNFLRSNNSGLMYYESYDSDKLRFREVR